MIPRRHLIGKTQADEALIAQVIAFKRRKLENAGFNVQERKQ